MNIISEIFIPGVIGIPIFTYAFFKWPKYAIAGLIIAKPIIDVSWDYHILLNINFLKIYAGLFVILGTIYIISNRPKILQHPISLIWLIFLGLNFISIFIISDAFMLIDKIKYFSSILTGFIALALFAHLFDYKKDKKFVLSIFIIAGIFPLLLWLIPVLIGNPILSNDELGRILGPYGRFWHFMFYSLQTIFCCFTYLAITSECEQKTNNRNRRDTNDHELGTNNTKYPRLISALSANLMRSLRLNVSVKSVLLYLMMIISVLMIYKCYSKAGWITLAVCFFIWFLLRKNYILASLIPVITAIIVFVNPFAKDFQKTFQNEIDYFIHGSNTKEMVFRGRLNRWETGFKKFNDIPMINKLFGSKKPLQLFRDPENDYLRILWSGGIFSFIVYVLVLSIAGYLLISKFFKSKDPFALMSILVLIKFIVISFGDYPLLQVNSQWFVWGTVGFVLGCKEQRGMTQSK